MSSRRPLLRQTSITIRLEHLLQELRSGAWSIPRFMRPFAWNQDQRLSLLDSIYRGFPIGSIVAWRTEHNELAVHPSLWDRDLDSDQRKQGVKTYIIDGHQRLATLYATLGYGRVYGRVSATRDHTYFFDLVGHSFHAAPKALAPPPTWVPMWVIHDHLARFEYMDSLRSHPAAHELFVELEELVHAFRAYQLPIISFASEEFEEVSEVFTRLNAGGQALNEVDMVSALTWTPSFDLNVWIEDLRAQLADEGWGEIPAPLVLNTFKAALDLELRGDVVYTAQALAANAARLDEIADHLTQAVTFLRRCCGIGGPRMLPYGHQLTCLTHVGIARTRTMDSSARERLRRWLWVTTYTEHFVTLNATQLHESLTRAHEVAEGHIDPLDIIEDPTVDPVERFDLRASRSRALALRMAELEPLGPDGTPLHAFTLLADLGAKAMPMLYTAREFGDDLDLRRSPANRLICPPRMARQLRALIRGELEHPARAEILASHGFDEATRAAAEHSDGEVVLRLRRAYLNAHERAFVEALGLHYAADA